MSQLNQDQYFYQVWQAFASNLGALRVFSQEASLRADQLDHMRIHELANDMAEMFNDDPLQVEQELIEFTPTLDNLEIFPDPRQDPKVQQMLRDFKDSKFKARVQRWALENPKKAYKFSDLFVDYLMQPPINGILLRRSAFISLIGFLEQLIENLLFGYYYYVAVPGIDNDQKEEKARRIAHRANFPQDGWRGRTKIFQKYGIDIGLAQCFVDELLEYAQRRNLIVHKDGVIDDQYIRNVAKEYLPQGANVGKILIVSSQYLAHSIQEVTLFAFAITQACMRQWHPRKNEKRADRTLESFIYLSLRKGYYELVVHLVDIGKQYQLSKLIEQMISIHQAVALRELKRIPDLRAVVNKLATEKQKWPIPIAIAILREDFTYAQRLLALAAQENKLPKISPYWPLFDPIRDDKWFKQMFEHPNHGDLPRN
jgi:hypothetical protein